MVTTDDKVLDYVQVSKTGDTLTIGLKIGYNLRSVTLNVKITMPALYSLELSGGAQGIFEEFSTSHALFLDLSGGSILRGDFVTSGDTEFDLSGGSQLI